MNWKKLFEPHILERGYGYYLNNAVNNLEVSEHTIRADVEGTEDYEVEISLVDGEIEEMYCSCPYAIGGWNCKHMAAVLYEWSVERGDQDNRDEEESGHIDTPEKQQIDIRKLVQDADINIIRNYLVSVLSEDEKLLIRFRGFLSGAESEENIGHYINRVDDIEYNYMGRDGFIDYDDAMDFIFDLEDVLNNDAKRLIDKGYHRSAFELMNHIFTVVGEADMDDSDGGIGMLATYVYKLWSELLTKADPDEKREMFQWFMGHLDGSIVDYLEEYIERIIMEQFEESEYLPPKMELASEKIRKYERIKDGWSRNYYVGKWAINYLSLLKQQSCGIEEIENFCRQHWENSSVRGYYIDLCMQSKEYDLALRTLDESMSLDEDFSGLISEYSEKKKEIYLIQGNREAYIGQLWELLLEHNVGSLETFRELKQQYSPEEWVEKREVIFQKLPSYADVKQLYAEEKLYDRLLDCVLKSPDLYALQAYEKVLAKIYPQQILEKYKVELDKMARHSGPRKHYQRLVSQLRRMQKIEGGKEAVKEIAAEWRQQYRNRPAMMEELGKVT
ncbi:MAG: SWIM zinc finger domain-containing protein [Anaerovoracaceae bacterium]